MGERGVRYFKNRKEASKGVLRLLALLPDTFDQVTEETEEADELSGLSFALADWARDALSPEEEEAARETSQLVEDEEG